MRTAAAVLLATLVFAAVGCDSKKDASTSASSSASAPAPAKASSMAMAAPDKAPGDSPAPGKSRGGPMMTEDAMYALMEGISAVFIDNADDCDKMAAALTKFFANNGDSMKKMADFGKTLTPEQKAAMSTKNVDQQKKAAAAIAKCGQNKNVQAAMMSLAAATH